MATEQTEAPPPGFRRYVALGDSLTEGMCDPAVEHVDGGNPWRGWADRLAEALADRAAAAGHDFDYANLAIRGKLLTEICAEQVGPALSLRPDLVSIIGGGNDVLRPGADVDAITAMLEESVARLRAAGVTVLMSTSYDPRHSPLVRRVRGPAAVFAANVWSIARRQGALVLDLWGMQVLQDRRLWAPDRIHLLPEGHARVAAQALELLGIDPPADGGHWSTLLDPAPAKRRQEALLEDAQWVREHVLPWVGRRLRGQSSGDGLPPKRAVPRPVAQR